MLFLFKLDSQKSVTELHLAHDVESEHRNTLYYCVDKTVLHTVLATQEASRVKSVNGRYNQQPNPRQWCVGWAPYHSPKSGI